MRTDMPLITLKSIKCDLAPNKEFKNEFKEEIKEEYHQEFHQKFNKVVNSREVML